MRLGARGKPVSQSVISRSRPARVTATRPDLNPTSERNGSEKGRPPGERVFESIQVYCRVRCPLPRVSFILLRLVLYVLVAARVAVGPNDGLKLDYQKQHLTLVPLRPLRPEPCTLAVRPSRGSHIGQDCPSARLERPSSSAEWPSAVVVLGRRRIGAAAACPGSSGVRVRARSRRYRQRR